MNHTEEKTLQIKKPLPEERLSVMECPDCWRSSLRETDKATTVPHLEGLKIKEIFSWNKT